MSIMSLNRIKYMRNCLDDENISQGELIEINEAFLQIPEEELPEPREHALAEDQLNELEERVTPFERELYNFVADNYGQSEADDPCYDLGEIANHLEDKFNITRGIKVHGLTPKELTLVIEALETVANDYQTDSSTNKLLELAKKLHKFEVKEK